MSLFVRIPPVQSSWLLPAYLLEFKGNNTFTFIWVESLAFFCANVGILAKIIRKYRERFDSPGCSHCKEQ